MLFYSLLTFLRTEKVLSAICTSLAWCDEKILSEDMRRALATNTHFQREVTVRSNTVRLGKG